MNHDVSHELAAGLDAGNYVHATTQPGKLLLRQIVGPPYWGRARRDG